MPINLLSQVIANRHLGPEGLGVYAYSVGICTDVCSFLDSGLGMAYYRKLCAEPRNRAWVVYFTRVVLSLLCLLGIGLGGMVASGWGARLWSGIDAPIAWLGAAVAAITWMASLVGKAADAHGLTKRTEIGRVLVRFVQLAALAGLAFSGALHLQSYFIIQITGLALIVGVWAIVVERAGHPVARLSPLTAEEGRRERNDMVAFVAPLLLYSAIGMLGGIFDRWLLLHSGGEAEQGYYAVGLQIGAICFIFTSALTQLLVGEYTRAVAQGDRERLRTLFRKSVGGLFVVASYMGFFCAANVHDILTIYAGEKFMLGQIPVAILCLYPLHQTYGQLSGSLFLAAGDSRQYSLIGIVTTVLGIPLSFLLVSDYAADLGATGMAVKLVSVQAILINVQLYFNSRYLGLSFAGLFFQQAGIILAFGVPAFGAAWLAAIMLGSGLIATSLSLVLYTCCAVIVIWFLNIGGLREDVRNTVQALSRRLLHPNP